MVAILVNVAKQRPATHLFFTSVGHREFHLRRKGENFEQKNLQIVQCKVIEVIICAIILVFQEVSDGIVTLTISPVC